MQMKLPNYVNGQWGEGTGSGEPLIDPVTGDELARISSQGFDLESEPGRRLIRRGRCYLHHEVLRENRSRAGGRKNVEGRRPDSFVEEQHVRWAAFSYASERRGCFYQRV